MKGKGTWKQKREHKQENYSGHKIKPGNERNLSQKLLIAAI